MNTIIPIYKYNRIVPKIYREYNFKKIMENTLIALKSSIQNCLVFVVVIKLFSIEKGGKKI